MVFDITEPPGQNVCQNLTLNTHLQVIIRPYFNIKFEFDESVCNCMLSTDTSKSNSTFGTFSDKCSGPKRAPGSKIRKTPKPKRGPKIFSESLEMGFSVETEDSNFRGHTIDCDSISATHHFLMIPVLKQS